MKSHILHVLITLLLAQSYCNLLLKCCLMYLDNFCAVIFLKRPNFQQSKTGDRTEEKVRKTRQNTCWTLDVTFDVCWDIDDDQSLMV